MHTNQPFIRPPFFSFGPAFLLGCLRFLARALLCYASILVMALHIKEVKGSRRIMVATMALIVAMSMR